MIRILHTNDFHGTLNDEREAALASLRRDCDLYFDSGDCIKAGNLGVSLRSEEVWPRLARLECTASVLGNRETHVLESAFQAKLKGASHPLLCANVFRKSGEPFLPSSLQIEQEGLKIGVFAVMVPMVTEHMKTQAASAFLWNDPIETVKQQVSELRSQVDCLIALTHIGFRQDEKLALACPEIDLIFGGHSHTVLEQPVQVGKTWICQGGSHGRFAGVYEWERGELQGGLRTL